MRDQIDFIKIHNGEWGAINFNNMIPVRMELINKIDTTSMSSDNIHTKQYKELLTNQLSWCNAHKNRIINTSNRLYSVIINNEATPALKQRCCDFKLLEQKLSEYIVQPEKINMPENLNKSSTDRAQNNKHQTSEVSDRLPTLSNMLSRARQRANEINQARQTTNFFTQTKGKDKNLD